MNTKCVSRGEFDRLPKPVRVVSIEWTRKQVRVELDLDDTQQHEQTAPNLDRQSVQVAAIARDGC